MKYRIDLFRIFDGVFVYYIHTQEGVVIWTGSWESCRDYFYIRSINDPLVELSPEERRLEKLRHAREVKKAASEDD